MSKEYENELESQIGDFGGEESAQPKPLGKLKHKAAYGQKEDLTESEKKSLEEFNKKADLLREKKKSEIQISDGWIPVNREEMGLRSIFYSQNWEFYIRPATVNAIKNWTSINEENANEVNKVFNEIIRTCVKIDSHDVNPASWDQINSWDRFWFIMKIREYTFPNNDSKVEFTDSCSECDDEINFNLTSNGLFYEFPDEDIIEKYWTGLKWEIDPSEYGLDHDIITLYTPRLCKDEAIIEWATNKIRAKQKIDETFIKYLVWLMDRPAKDPAMLDRQIQKIYNEYKKWDIDTFNFITDVINNININPSEKLKTICPSCGREVTSNVQFPNGIKTLFAAKSSIKKFGSR